MPSKKNIILFLISPFPKNKDISVDDKDETPLAAPINERDNT